MFLSRLLLFAGLVLLRRFQAAEQPVSFGYWTRGEKERIESSRPTAVAEGQSPKAFDRDRPAVYILEQTMEFAVRSKAHDGAVAEVSYEQITTMLAK